jgi:hypothetical protein
MIIYKVNIETPFEVEDGEKLMMFIDPLIERREVYPNKMYSFMVYQWKSNNKVLRSGYEFNFWFKNKIKAEEFRSLWCGSDIIEEEKNEK